MLIPLPSDKDTSPNTHPLSAQTPPSPIQDGDPADRGISDKRRPNTTTTSQISLEICASNWRHERGRSIAHARTASRLPVMPCKPGSSIRQRGRHCLADHGSPELVLVCAALAEAAAVGYAKGSRGSHRVSHYLTYRLSKAE